MRIESHFGFGNSNFGIEKEKVILNLFQNLNIFNQTNQKNEKNQRNQKKAFWISEFEFEKECHPEPGAEEFQWCQVSSKSETAL